jgi:Polyketide cyclase / dehydrase and lipid transport
MRYMITDSAVEIYAPASVVWDVFTDVERWPEWTDSVTRLVALDGPGLEVGKRFEIKQPRMPKLVWQVTEVTPGAGWTWVQRSPGGLTSARHEVIPESAGRTRVLQQIDQRGPIGAVVGVLMRGMTKRYLELEAAGLKARSEQLRHLDGPAS